MSVADDASVEPPVDDPGGEEPIRKRLRDRLVVRIVVLLCSLLVIYAAVTFIQVWQASRADETPRAGAIVVLGAAQYNGRPSPILAARLAHGLDLYERHLAPVVVVTGGRRTGDRFTEATSGYNWLRGRGVPDAAILKEVQGTNTWETLQAVARFLKARHVEDVILVSDVSHSKRLLGISSEVGLVGHVSPERSIHRSRRGSARALARETAAVGLGRIIGYGRMTRLLG